MSEDSKHIVTRDRLPSSWRDMDPLPALIEERELQAKRTDRRFRRIDCDAALARLEMRLTR